MDFPLLRRYLLKAAVATTDPALQNNMIRLLQQVSPGAPTDEVAAQEHKETEVVAPDLNHCLPSQNQKPKGVEDLMLRQALPEIQQPNPETPEVFGKVNVPDSAKVTKVSMWQALTKKTKNQSNTVGLNQTHSNGVPGAYFVDDSCTDCDLCRETAPNNFKRDAAKGVAYVFKQPSNPQESSQCSAAKNTCPVKAIKRKAFLTKVSMWTVLKRATEMRVKMSAYIKDVRIADLPKEIHEDINRFIPKDSENAQVIHYGLTLKELLDRVDPHNFKSAQKFVKAQLGEIDEPTRQKIYKELREKANNKYVLMVNDKVVDGHHFLAKAKHVGFTNSINVLDLTPARFQ